MVSSDSLTIELVADDDSQSLSLEAFSKVISAVRSMLKGLDETKTVQWRLGAISMQSPCTVTIVEVAPKGAVVPRKRIDDFVSVLASISQGTKPPRVARRVIARGRTLVQTLNTGLERITISSPGRQTISPQKRSLEETRESIKAVEVPDYSGNLQLEGYLRVIGLVHDRRIVEVVDRLSGHRTECTLNDSDFVLALEAMKLAPNHVARVAATGMAEYSKDKPIRMKVDKLEVFPVQDDVAVFYAVQGIDITGGMDSVDFVRGLWND